MWVFGYGSLMWDDWEKQFEGVKYNRARLKDYHRAFNKSSTRNWGTSKQPCPTLGLERLDGAECIGCAFEFEDNRRELIRAFLADREGSSFELVEIDVDLEGGITVKAIVSINKHNVNTYIGNLSIEKQSKMAKVASGRDGRCFDYVQSIHDKLRELDIEDAYVEQIWKALQEVIKT